MRRLRALTSSPGAQEYAVLKVRHAASAKMLVNHPQVDIFQALEYGTLCHLKRQSMCLADSVAVVPINQHLTPQHQGIPASFGQKAAFQRFIFFRSQRVNVGFQFFVDDDVHGQGAGYRFVGQGARMVGSAGCLGVWHRLPVATRSDMLSRGKLVMSGTMPIRISAVTISTPFGIG